jgi:hypothetical protein
VNVVIDPGAIEIDAAMTGVGGEKDKAMNAQNENIDSSIRDKLGSLLKSLETDRDFEAQVTEIKNQLLELPIENRFVLALNYRAIWRRTEVILNIVHVYEHTSLEELHRDEFTMKIKQELEALRRDINIAINEIISKA